MSKKFLKRFNWKAFWIGVVAVVLILVTTGSMTAVITNLGLKKVNEDNLYTADCVTLKDKTDGDLKINVKRNGSIVLNGESGDEDETYKIGTIDLKAGTYTLTANKDCSTTTCYVTITANQTEYKFDLAGVNTITLEADAVDCAINLHVKADVEFDNFELLPVIVEGDKSGDFYA